MWRGIRAAVAASMLMGLALPLGGCSAARADGSHADRGFRQAERVLAAMVEIRNSQKSYLEKVAGDRQVESCRAARRCTYTRYFDISSGARSQLALLFILDLSDFGDIACDRTRADNGCDISAAVLVTGDEVFPHCVGVGPLRRAAASQGWRHHPFRHPVEDNAVRYRHSDDHYTFMFIRTLGDNRCFKNVYIARFPVPEDTIRN